ncbi:MAG: hypothetical protein ACI9G1_005810 [Pirellulaceae bacterium]|jgi:hypothetical protein
MAEYRMAENRMAENRMATVSRRELIQRSLLAGGALASGCFPNGLAAADDTKPTNQLELAEAMRKRLVEQLQTFKPQQAVHPVGDHLKVIAKVHEQYRDYLEQAGLNYQPLIRTASDFATAMKNRPLESSSTPPIVPFIAADTRVQQLHEPNYGVRLVLGIYNPHPTWQNRIYCKVFVGEANLILDIEDAVRAIDDRFPVLTEPGVRGETPDVPSLALNVNQTYVLPPFPSVNTERTAQQGMVMPPYPISIWEDKPYSLPPAFRTLGFTIKAPNQLISRSINASSTNFIGHAVIFKLNTIGSSYIEQRLSFAFRT